MTTVQVRFKCSQCGKQYSTPSSFAGKTLNCTCGMKLTVPNANAAVQPTPAVTQQQPTLPIGGPQSWHHSRIFDEILSCLRTSCRC